MSSKEKEENVSEEEMNSDMHTSSDSDVSSDEDASRTSMGEKTPKRPSKRLKSGAVDEAAFASAFNAKYSEYCEDMSFTSPNGGTSKSIRDLLSSSRKKSVSIMEEKKEEEEEDEVEEEGEEKEEEEEMLDMNAAHDYFGKNRNVSKEIKCFNCGGRGHMRADCPKAKKMKCPLCAGAHDTFSCPDRRCILCTKRGHIASDCPERGRRRLECKMCGPQVCHITVSCPKVVSSRNHLHSKILCIICGELGHLRCDDDENVEKKKKNINVTCYNCGSQFHDASACKLPREAALLRMHRAKQSASIAASIRSGVFNNGGMSRGNSNLTCWNCNGIGHVSRDCPKKNMIARGGGRGRGRFSGGRGGRRGGRGGHRGGRRIHIGNKRKR